MPAKQLMVGAGKTDITAPLNVPYLGFSPRAALFEGVHDPLYARAALFEAPSGVVAILSADALGLSTDLFGPGRDFIAEVRQRACEGTGLAPEQILLAATHAHSTPETYGIVRIWERADCAEWIDQFADRLASTIRAAWADRCPAQVSTGRGTINGMSGNRRMQDELGRIFSENRKPEGAVITDRGCLDESVKVLLAQREHKPPVAVSNFACHPVTMQVQELVSADYPGVGMRLVEQALGEGSCSLFLQGASGDINPINDASRDWRDVDTFGLMLAGGVLHAVGGARLSEADDGPIIGAMTKTIEVDARDAPSVTQAEETLRAAEERYESLADDAPDKQQAFAAVRAADEAFRLAQFGRGPIPAEIQALRIGDTAVASFPGELFCELGLMTQEKSPARTTMIAECANGSLGYLHPERVWDEGGYEVGMGAWCRVARGGPERLVVASGELLEELFGD